MPRSSYNALTDIASDPAYTDQRTLGLSGWKKNSVSSRAQHQPRHHRLRRAIPRLSAHPHQSKIPSLLPRACNDPPQPRPVGTRLLSRAHGRPLLGHRLRAVLRRLTMGLRAPAMMALSTSGDRTDGSRLSERRLCRICCLRQQHVNVSSDILFRVQRGHA